MNSLEIKSYAKINLFLDIVGKREDGYHNILTIFQMISFHDNIKISIKNGKGIKVITSNKNIPDDDRNLAYKAALYFLIETKIYKGIEIRIKKNIPTGGGLGGGSSNASATLLGLNKLFKKPLDIKRLKEISEKIGSDCPFFLVGGTVLAEEKGNKFKEFLPTPKLYILVFYPGFEVKTEYAYKNFLNHLTKKNIDVSLIINAIKGKRDIEIGKYLYNAFEDGYFKEHKDIYQLFNILKNGKCLGGGVAGSGSCIYTIYRKKGDLLEDFNYLKNYGDVWIARTVSSSEYLKTFNLLEDELCRLLK
uniref:4-diphosphocytidyl-2-C-methyl-D-erythritol kinase n=1 Tax=candidate division WOR-3 bacterium TaxID=2052148 RepID=A0A7C4Y480_UNCW3